MAFKNFDMSCIDNIIFAVDLDVKVLTEIEYATLYPGVETPSDKDNKKETEEAKADAYGFEEITLD